MNADLNSLMQSSLANANTMNGVIVNAARDGQRKSQAIFDTADATRKTAEATNALREQVNKISNGLDAEREERKREDAKNFEYTQKIDKKYLFWTRFAAITAVLALLVSIASLFFSVTGFKIDFSLNPTAYAQTASESGNDASDNRQ